MIIREVIMSKCDLIEKCAFFNGKVRDLRQVGDIIKQFYCKEDDIG